MRSVIAASLFTLLSVSFAPLAHAEQRFAQPPPSRSGAVAQQDLDAPAAFPRMEMLVQRADVHAALVTNRAKNLAAFRAYQRKGVFPSNTHADGALNVWRDRAGNFCAAATIIRASGGVALADKIAEQHNFIKLGDVSQGPVMDWILTSGFTQAEIAAIQEPFMPVSRRRPPIEQPTVEPDLRTAETKRLVQKYRAVEQQLITNEAASLAAAVDRLMHNEALAAQLVAASAPAAS